MTTYISNLMFWIVANMSNGLFFLRYYYYWITRLPYRVYQYHYYKYKGYGYRQDGSHRIFSIPSGYKTTDGLDILDHVPVSIFNPQLYRYRNDKRITFQPRYVSTYRSFEVEGGLWKSMTIIRKDLHGNIK